MMAPSSIGIQIWSMVELAFNGVAKTHSRLWVQLSENINKKAYHGKAHSRKEGRE